MSNFIPVNMPDISGRERDYLIECIETGWISSEGPFVKRFEEEFAASVSRAHGIAVANGSAALDIAVAALNIGVEDEVIMPAFTIISCAAAVVRAGAKPILVDSDPSTWNMNITEIESRITRKTRAIMVVHVYGLPVDMAPVLDLADRYGLHVIEDAAEMHGQTWRDRPCGSFGTISTFSFYPNKHITTGEGGMIVTDDATLAERCQSLRNLCFQRERRFVHTEIGWNYRMTNMQAALGLAQMERLPAFVERKRRMGRRYNTLFNGISGLILPPTKTEFAESIYWVYGLMLDDALAVDAEEVMKLLAKEGVGTRPFFWPMHEQPVFLNRGWYRGERYVTAEKMARRGFYVPSGLGLAEADQDRVADAMVRVISQLS